MQVWGGHDMSETSSKPTMSKEGGPPALQEVVSVTTGLLLFLGLSKQKAVIEKREEEHRTSSIASFGKGEGKCGCDL